ncbi:MAG: signal peptidase I [Clostridia bacterium]|nr:signal peptidase I [Clostridia bacterium]
MTEKTSNNKSKRIIVLTSLLIILVTFFGSIIFLSTAITPYKITGESMNNTFLNEQLTLIFKTKKVKYGDVIVFTYIKEDNSSIDMIKRVIGLPGDKIEIKADAENNNVYHIYRNGEKLVENYIKEPMTYEGGYHNITEITVPQNSIYVLGDNRNESEDSHKGIYANYETIQGKVFFNVTTFKFV